MANLLLIALPVYDRNPPFIDGYKYISGLSVDFLSGLISGRFGVSGAVFDAGKGGFGHIFFKGF